MIIVNKKRITKQHTKRLISNHMIPSPCVVRS